MTTLYYSPGTCSLSPHILLREAGLPFELQHVELMSKELKGGGTLFSISPLGQVPVLKLDNGEILTEGPAIVQYIADQVPAAKLAPANGTLERYKLQSWLNFITSELHKTFTPLFNPTTVEETRKVFLDRLNNKLGHLDNHLSDKPYIMGADFTVADAYAFTVINWTNFLKIDISQFKNIAAYVARIAARPKVQEAMKAEGLVK
ncbi:MAG TPA: glutathione transferase GstA [Azospirillaceae bacterium]|nr:glutathione transferase GstA [Azospirillaceae bacterium]